MFLIIFFHLDIAFRRALQLYIFDSQQCQGPQSSTSEFCVVFLRTFGPVSNHTGMELTTLAHHVCVLAPDLKPEIYDRLQTSSLTDRSEHEKGQNLRNCSYNTFLPRSL